MNQPKIFSLGDAALTIEFGNQISIEQSERALKFAHKIEKEKFKGFVEIVPAYSSVTVFYDLVEVRKNYGNFPTAFAAVKALVEKLLTEPDEVLPNQSRVVKIPVCFDSEFAFDLDSVAAQNQLTANDVVEIFLRKTYRVFMLGFLPGFAYMGELDARIAAPRKAAPRLKIPAGSVGIAGRQTGIYSLESPGGWQIIGRTPVCLFDSTSNDLPVYFKPGDAVQFYAIDKAVYENSGREQSTIRNSKSEIK